MGDDLIFLFPSGLDKTEQIKMDPRHQYREGTEFYTEQLRATHVEKMDIIRINVLRRPALILLKW